MLPGKNRQLYDAARKRIEQQKRQKRYAHPNPTPKLSGFRRQTPY